MDVVEMQIAVTIKNPMLLDPLEEKFLVRSVEMVCVMANCCESSRRNCFANEWSNLREVFVGADLQFFGRPPPFNLRRRSFRFVKAMESGDHPPNVGFAH